MDEFPKLDLGINFPDPRVEAAARAREFRRFSPKQQLRQIADMTAFGLNLVRQNPLRESIEARWATERAEYQRIQRELFERHAV